MFRYCKDLTRPFREKLSMIFTVSFALVNHQNEHDARVRMVKLSESLFLATLFLLDKINSHSWTRNHTSKMHSCSEKISAKKELLYFFMVFFSFNKKIDTI